MLLQLLLWLLNYYLFYAYEQGASWFVKFRLELIAWEICLKFYFNSYALGLAIYGQIFCTHFLHFNCLKLCVSDLYSKCYIYLYFSAKFCFLIASYFAILMSTYKFHMDLCFSATTSLFSCFTWCISVFDLRELQHAD